ncbi:hypothetical protein O6H91_Y396100 [Diphasiastrum complanatum]|nr:hypothetical protein O6H91_Y396100 [Diphasiastrum complanatum]
MAMAMAMAMRAICPTFSSTNRPFIHHNAIANAAAAVAIVLEHSFQTYICSSASCSSTRRLHQLKQNNVHYPKEGIRLKVQCGNGGAKGRLILGITVVNVSKRYSGSPRNCGLGVHATTDEEYEKAISIDLNEDTSKETSSSIGTSNVRYVLLFLVGDLNSYPRISIFVQFFFPERGYIIPSFLC